MANGRSSAALDQAGASARVDRAEPHGGGTAQTRSKKRGCDTPIVGPVSAACDRNKQSSCVEQRLARGPPLLGDPHRLLPGNPDARRTEWPRHAISSR